jgi:hypothetical protein
MATLPAFNSDEKDLAKKLLATTVAQMMGRKFEEGDWGAVYCKAKNIPEQQWSNLHIDVMHNGLGVEHKMLKIGGDQPLMQSAGTSKLHPSATRSIRIDSTDISPQDAMEDVFAQYADLIEKRKLYVTERAHGNPADMRIGWLLWERTLTEFLYFEEPMVAPDPALYWAEWNERAAMGSRKPSKNLWIYEKSTNKKCYSVTTSAGPKIQPYFDIPAPNDPNLYHFRVQSEPIGSTNIQIWIAASTAKKLREVLHDPNLNSLSQKIIEIATDGSLIIDEIDDIGGLAVPVIISKDAHQALVSRWEGVSDEHRIQLLLQTLQA